VAARLGDVAAGWHAAREPDVAADGRSLPDGDPAKNGGTGIDDDLVLDDRMARQPLLQVAFPVSGETFRTQGYALVHAHPLTDDRSFTDDDARAVVDEEACAYVRARMDVDAGLAVGFLGDDPGGQRGAQPVQGVGDPMVDHRLDAGVAKQHFVHAACRRIAVEGGQHVGVEEGAYPRQRGGKLVDDGLRLAVGVGLSLAALPCGMAQFEADLGDERLEHCLQRMADVVVLAFPALAQVGRTQTHRKQRAAQAVDHAVDGFPRRQLATRGIQRPMHRVAPLLALCAQLGDDACKLEFRRSLYHGADCGRSMPWRRLES
jgi:hypothetical protein